MSDTPSKPSGKKTSRPPARTPDSAKTGGPSDAVAAFIKDAQAIGAPRALAERRGRLVLIIDATMSREATWDLACTLQGEMFTAAEEHGGLDVKLVFFRGFDECRASRWTSEPKRLARAMGGVRCLAGRTQISRALRFALDEAQGPGGVNAVVYVGDCFEEAVDPIADICGRLRLRGTRVFFFHEGDDHGARRAFEGCAKAGGGAVYAFDHRAPDVLRDLLGAVAAYAAGGAQAVKAYARGRGRAAQSVAGLLGDRREN